MPRATVDSKAEHKFDLQSLEGAYIILRKLSYGEMMQRQSLASDVAIKEEKRKAEMTIQMMQERVTEYEYTRSIVDHNLEDETGNKLDFNKPGTAARLDPQVGAEVSQLIDSLNQFDLGESKA